MSETEQLIIIGSGPAAWSAAIYASRADFNPLVLAGENPGGQLMLTTEVENFPGFAAGIDGPVLMSQMREQAMRFKTRIADETVTKVEPTEAGLKIITTNNQYLTKAVIVATGAQARWLNVPGEKEFVGRGVSACAVCDAAFFRGKETVVVGGGDAAMEDAIAVARFASKVTVIHRRDTFKACKVMADRVKSKDNISILWNSAVEEVRGSKSVEAVIIKNVLDGSVQSLPTSGIFVAIGHEPATAFLRGTIDLNDKGYVITGLTAKAGELGEDLWMNGYPTATNIKGVFAGGDCVDFRYRQASTAAGFGVMAALDAEKYIETLQE